MTYFWRVASPGHLTPSCLQDTEIDLDSYRTATLLESRNLIEAGTTGLTTWDASLVLANFLVKHRERLDLGSRRILELGCGAGFLGIVVAQLQLDTFNIAGGGKNTRPALTLSDINDDVLTRARRNVRLPCSGSL